MSSRAAKVTFSVAIEPELKAALTARAKQLHGGNMSELVAEMGRQAVTSRRTRTHARAARRFTDEARAKVDDELEEGWRHARSFSKPG